MKPAEDPTLRVKSFSYSLPVLITVVSLLANSIEPVVVKLGFKQNASAIDLLFMKGMVGAILITSLAKHVYWIGWQAFRTFLPLCMLFFAVNSFVFFALHDMSAVALITIITTTPAFVGLVNHYRKRLVLDEKFWLGFGLCFAGVLFTIDVFKPQASHFGRTGLCFALAAVAGSTLYRTRMDDITDKYSTYLVSFYVFVVNGLLGLLWLPWVNLAACQRTLPTGLWLGMAAMIANVAFLGAIKHLGSTRISLISTLQRPVVILASVLVLHETMKLSQIFGILLVIIGVWQARTLSIPKRIGSNKRA